MATTKQEAVFQWQDAERPLTRFEQAVELAARALWLDDCQRTGARLFDPERVWPRVRGEYKRRARIAFDAVKPFLAVSDKPQ